MNRTSWHNNYTAECMPCIRQYIGGLVGFTESLLIERHAPVCKPGLWRVALALGSEVLNLIGVEQHATAAVQDDFGNLVRVPS